MRSRGESAVSVASTEAKLGIHLGYQMLNEVLQVVCFDMPSDEDQTPVDRMPRSSKQSYYDLGRL